MATDAVNLLLTKIMTDKYCSAEKRDFTACVAYYVPSHTDGSYVDLSLQRRGTRKCEDHSKALQQCLQDDKRQTAVMRAASKHTQCKDERNTLVKCQQAAGGNKGACDPQFYALLECGMVHIIQGMRGGGGGGGSAGAASGAHTLQDA
jgi:hypothetical protein